MIKIVITIETSEDERKPLKPRVWESLEDVLQDMTEADVIRGINHILRRGYPKTTRSRK